MKHITTGVNIEFVAKKKKNDISWVENVSPYHLLFKIIQSCKADAHADVELTVWDI